MNKNEVKNYLIEKKKKLCAMVLAGAVTLPLIGCGENDSLLQDTILENAIVIEIYGEKRIVRVLNSGWHKHYVDITNGIRYADEKHACADCDVFMESLPKENLSLTKEELEKAINKSLTDEDILDIIDRINQEKVELEETENSLSRQ